ncbi:MAG: hypothetical protein EA351_09830 [Gemmatimonadales bacterium]|nr:MAG: hypothetical protein EA351_09830 [Gemmatimonadales bacterium]
MLHLNSPVGLVVGLVLMSLLFTGCLRDPPPPTDPELAEELGLPSGTVFHRIHLGGTGARTRVLPGAVTLEPGAWVQFIVEDHRVHVVRFLLEEMDPAAAEFLRRSEQTASPPLTQRGSRQLFSFEDAPNGSYPFVVEGYGDPVRGLLRVGSEE